MDINFEDTTTNTEFNFGLSGEFTDLEFTVSDLSDGNVQYDFEFGANADRAFYKLLKGDSNYFTSIWCDPNASLTSGTFYVGRENDLTIISNNNGQALMKDYYSFSQQGFSGDTLTAEDIVDINVVG